MSLMRQGLPWNQENGERKRLLRIVSVVCPIFFVIAIYVTWTDLPEQDREDLEKLPPQLAKVMLKKKEPPKPIVKKEEKKPEPPKPEPEKVAEKPKPVLKKEEKKPEPQVAKKPKPKIEPKPKEIELAREKAKNSGILAMSSQLSKLSALAENVKLDTPKTVTAKPIARKPSDKLANVASNHTKSAGVDAAQLTQETQEMTLSARAVTEVEAAEEVVAQVEAEEAAREAMIAQRTTEEVRRTMDSNKSAIHSIYNRALRKRPSLQGVVTPELVIEPNGIVSSCAVVESTLNEPKLESKICNRLRLVNFGHKDGVDKTTIRYPIELLPG